MSRESILDRLVDQHEARINKVLYTLEDDIVSSIVNSTKNNVVSTQIAIQLRPQLKALIEKNFLKEADAVIRDYDKVVDEFMKEFGVLNIPDEFKTLTQANLETITALKYQTFRGFEDVAGRFLNVIGDEVYQSAIAGKPFNETVKAIRGAINGVYQRSNEQAINRLTRYIDLNRYSSDPLKVARVKEARKILHTKYASDILGNNMRRYAGQIAHDSLMQFDGSFILSKAKEAGLNNFQYNGTLVRDSRDFCRRNQGRTFTQDEANKEWQRSWAGKSSSDPFTARGGYRCRHHWLVVTDIVEEKKPEAKPKPKPKSVANNVVISSLLNRGSTKTRQAYDDDFNSQLTDQQKIIVDKFDKPKIIKNGKSGFYQVNSGILSAELNAIDKAKFKRGAVALEDKGVKSYVISHEYGHHIDFITNKSSAKSWSATNDDFRKAIERDKRRFKGTNNPDLTGRNPEGYYVIDSSELQGLFDKIATKKTLPIYSKNGTKIANAPVTQLLNDGYGNVSDIVDALVAGRFRKNFKSWGHSESYWGKLGHMEEEIFANLFSLQHDKKAYALVKEIIPNTVTEFEKRMKILENL
tara:strand:+ start:759 stop:2504 length:1746 start_codon:yes stop_codon:yes gene_type:complete